MVLDCWAAYYGSARGLGLLNFRRAAIQALDKGELVVFFLTEDTPFTVEPPANLAKPNGSESVGWRTLSFEFSTRFGLVVLALAKVVIGCVTIGKDDACLITVGAALHEISPDGLDVFVRFRPARSGPEVLLAAHTITEFNPREPFIELRPSLNSIVGMTGKIVIECGPGPENDPVSDWLALYELVIAPRDSFRLTRASTFKERRTANEIEDFNYRYLENPLDLNKIDGSPNSGLDTTESQATKPNNAVQAVDPLPEAHSDAYSFALALLSSHLQPPPDFATRMRTRWQRHRDDGKDRKIRMLSLCCGTARVEPNLIANVPGDMLDLTIFDLNKRMLEVATASCK